MHVDPMRMHPVPAIEQPQQPAAGQARRWSHTLAWYGFVPGAAIAVYGTAFLLLSRLLSS